MDICRARAGLDLRGPYCFSKDHFFGPNDHIFHCLNMHQNWPNLEYTHHKNCDNLLSSSISTTRWCYNQGNCILAYESHKLCHTFKNFISMRSLNCVESRHIGHAHFRLLFIFFHKFAKCCKPTFSKSSQVFTPMCTKLCTQHLWTLLTKKNIKRILIFQTILKLLNNCLYILLKTQSVAYLHIGLSQWHETQVITSPWATKALSKVLLDDYKVVLFKLKSFISQHRLVGLRQNLVKFLPMPSWGQLTKLLPVCH